MNIGCNPKTIILEKSEQLDDLQTHNLHLIQNKKGYHFSCDSIFLANLASVKKQSNICEFCAGSGVISLLLAAKKHPKHIDCIEIQDNLFSILKKNIINNNLSNVINCYNESIENASKILGFEKYDIVIANPPYFFETSKNDTGSEKLIARQEKSFSFEMFVKSAKNILKYGGKLIFVYKTTRLAESIAVLKSMELEPKRLRLIQPKMSKKSNVFFMEAIKGGRPELNVELPLVIQNEDGTETDEIITMYDRKSSN